MGAFSRWLLHDDQKELFEYLYVNVLCVVFLGLVALLLWPADKASLALALAKGYWVLWIALSWTALPLYLSQRAFRVDLDTHPDAYIISGLAVGGFVQAGWAAFAVLAVRDSAAGAPTWLAVALYFVGALSCYVAFGVVSIYYQGQIYKSVNLPLSVASFALFAVWPAAGRALYGWFFDLASAAYRWLFDLIF